MSPRLPFPGFLNPRAMRVIGLATLGIMLTAAAPATAAFNLFGIPGLTLAGVGSTGTMLGVFAYMMREWRADRKLSAEDKLARREGYVKQVELLTGENRLLMADQHQLRKEYDEYRRICHAETEELRKGMIAFENEIAGYKRRLDGQAMEIAKLSGGSAALDRLSVIGASGGAVNLGSDT